MRCNGPATHYESEEAQSERKLYINVTKMFSPLLVGTSPSHHCKKKKKKRLLAAICLIEVWIFSMFVGGYAYFLNTCYLSLAKIIKILPVK